ncbi:hypothetical protein SAMN02745121_06096 [Nannocystis exedens]|uniref:Transmembrane protein n=1 Tax=Nannocystis exedens TaxID=54 RepID=A0A1I2EGR8_9BACT|nr:hypothetical protein [Nannocystis exedens]PCC74727.1 hypothetical protein NAEX_07824 [Nannocystis exedens]SFE91939.1 hypothetical protein SAMN02745121_06096 [Nannocystis exedens]
MTAPDPQDRARDGLYRLLAAAMTYGWARLMAFMAWMALLVSTYASLDGVIGEGTVSPLGLVTLKTVPLLLAVLVALPNVMLHIVARMILFRFSRRNFNLLCRDAPAEAALPDEVKARCQATWAYERGRAQMRYESGLLPQVGVFGLLASAMLAFCILGIHLPPSQLFPNLGGELPTWHIWVAWTVLSTATTSFMLSVGRILVRIAGYDATTRTFADAARSFGLCVVSGGLLACLTVSSTDPKTAQASIAMGIAVGLLGDRAFIAVSNRAAALLGTEVEVTEPGIGLRVIEGVGAEDSQRLQEENVSSVHALAFVPVPRLFFNSSLNLQRICDWQDQALLFVYVGESRAKALREQFQIRGAIDAQRLGRGFEDMPAEVQQQLVVSLNFPSPTHARQLFARLAVDPRIDELRAYRAAELSLEPLLDERPALRRA